MSCIWIFDIWVIIGIVNEKICYWSYVNNEILGSIYFVNLQIGNIIFVGKILPNFRQKYRHKFINILLVTEFAVMRQICPAGRFGAGRYTFIKNDPYRIQIKNLYFFLKVAIFINSQIYKTNAKYYFNYFKQIIKMNYYTLAR